MPGLYIKVDQGSTVTPDVAEEMRRRLAHDQNWFDHKLLTIPHGFHGIVTFQTHLRHKHAVSPLGNQALVHGEIYPYNGGEVLPHTANEAELVLALYEKYGEEFVRYLNGAFCISLYDAQAQLLILVTDRFGAKPLYRDMRTSALVVSSEIKAVLVNAPHPAYNPAAVVSLLTMQHPLKHDTYFEGIEVLPPGSLLIYHLREHRSEIRTYWSFNLQNEPPALEGVPLETLIEQYAATMETTLERQMAPYERIATFISGGIDSRLMLGFAKRVADKHHKQLHAYTFGTKYGYQNMPARRIAKALGVEHRLRTIADDSLARYAEEIVWNGDGLIRLRDGHFVSHMAEVREGADAVLADYMSGLFFGSHLTPPMLDITDKRVLGDLIFKEKRIDFIADPARNIIARDFVPDFDQLARRTFDETVEGIPSDVIYKIAFFWDLDQRGRRYVLPITNYPAWYIPCVDPCVDNAITDLAFGLPVKFLIRKNFLERVQLRVFPEMSKIPFEAAPPSGTSNFGWLAFRAIRYAARNAAFGLQKYSRGKILIKGRDYRAYDYWIKTASRSFVQDLIMDKRAFEGLFIDQSALQQVLKEHLTAQYDHNQLICDAINFILIHRYFVQSD
ncbi:MAG: hypothetical protein JXA21_03380 [Anaerolineae bacterium]|nr:hypothetical protein [Anaerolineae bacterium]